MEKMKRQFAMAMVAIMLLSVLTVMPVTSVPAKQMDLFFLVDGSGSIESSDFQLQKEGLAHAISDPEVIPYDGSVSVCVILFSSYPSLEVPHTTITSQSVADSISADIMAMSQPSGSTNMSGAFDLAVANIPSIPAKRRVIDLSTDGEPYTNGEYRYSETLSARDAAVDAGFEVNAIGVGTGINEEFLKSLVYPQPWTKAPGFYMYASDFPDFKDKIREKIIKELKPICEPCVSIKVDVSINKNSYTSGDIFVYNVSVRNNQTYKPGKSRIAISYGLIDPTPKTIIIGTRMPDINLNDTYNFSGDFIVPDDVYSGNYVLFAAAIDMDTGCSGIDAKPYSVKLMHISKASKEEAWKNWLEIVEI